MAEKRLAFIFGAGASYAEGFPLNRELLWKITRDVGDATASAKLLRRFLSEVYNLNAESKDGFPPLEHILGILELSLDEYSPLGLKYQPVDILGIRKALVAGLIHALSRPSGPAEGFGIYKALIDRVADLGIACSNVSYITLNYDLLLDTSFEHLYPESKLDLGLDLLNYEGILTDPFNWWDKPDRPDQTIKLLKPHGSLSFNYCPYCRCVELIPFGLVYKQKIGSESPERLFEIIDSDALVCPRDRQSSVILVVPPSLSKKMDIPPIQILWAKTARILLESTHLFFIGYSLPLADLHVWHLLKQCVLINRPSKIVVVDGVSKNDLETKQRYEKIYREVEYLPIGFESFVKENRLASVV